ncbi:hypothetical protein [Sphingomonas sp.]|uniref:hypothetical protein n=1 Tax=Sphingomonas sp. TaxID=28214 RepID=UPI003CC5A947
MQERYLGDVHDFLKYALLRHCAAMLGNAVGLNWYLTHQDAVDPAGNGDGRQRRYRDDPSWAGTDDDLRAGLAKFDGGPLAAFETGGVLPAGTLFFGEPVPCGDRSIWHSRALAALAGAGLVFLDPDNGFAVPSATRRRLPKYARYEEAAAYLDRGQALLAVQFARQCDVTARARASRAALLAAAREAAPLPVLRCRVSPTILIVGAAPPSVAEAVQAAMIGFAGRNVARLSLID